MPILKPKSYYQTATNPVAPLVTPTLGTPVAPYVPAPFVPTPVVQPTPTAVGAPPMTPPNSVSTPLPAAPAGSTPAMRPYERPNSMGADTSGFGKWGQDTFADRLPGPGVAFGALGGLGGMPYPARESAPQSDVVAWAPRASEWAQDYQTRYNNEARRATTLDQRQTDQRQARYDRGELGTAPNVLMQPLLQSPDFTGLTRERASMTPILEQQQRGQQAYNVLAGYGQTNGIMGAEYSQPGFGQVNGDFGQGKLGGSVYENAFNNGTFSALTGDTRNAAFKEQAADQQTAVGDYFKILDARRSGQLTDKDGWGAFTTGLGSTGVFGSINPTVQRWNL